MWRPTRSNHFEPDVSDGSESDVPEFDDLQPRCYEFLAREPDGAGPDDPKLLVYDFKPEYGGVSIVKPGTSSRNGLCRRCFKINPTSTDYSKNLNPVKLGPIDKLISRNCSFCEFIYRLLKIEPKVYGHISASDEAYLYSVRNDRISPLSLRVGNSERARIFVEDLIEEGTTLTPSLIWNSPLSLSLVRQWLVECEEVHGDDCNIRSNSGDLGIYLIDVNRLCIIKASTSRRYIALSYVVGGKNGPQLTKENSIRLFEDNSLTPEGLAAIEEQNITKVARDAIEMVKSLDEQFLWIDSLCIVQNDATTKHEQIMNMDTIYSRALLTIVSVSGDSSDYGLPGVEHGLRQPMDLSTYLNGNKMLGQPPDINDILASSPYETRGWTFQERILSPRCLYLSNWQAYFQCRRGLQREGSCIHRISGADSIQSDPKQFDKIQKLRSLRGRYAALPPATLPLHGIQRDSPHSQDRTPKMLYNYARLVEQYTQRRLTFESDILNAFGGVVSALERKYQARFKYGIPVDCLETSLLWSPVGPRRARGLIRFGDEEISFPTWSWAAWNGLIGYHIVDQTNMNPPFSCINEMEMVGFGESESDFTLEFWTATSPLSRFAIYQHPQDRKANRVTELGLNRVKCGLLFENDDVIKGNPSAHGNRELLVISSSVLRGSNAHQLSRPCYGKPDARHLDFKFAPSEFSYEDGTRSVIHVMLVQWKGDFAERVAVGLIHRDAWDKVQTKRKLIKLR